jgi:hypothetical protein
MKRPPKVTGHARVPVANWFFELRISHAMENGGPRREIGDAEIGTVRPAANAMAHDSNATARNGNRLMKPAADGTCEECVCDAAVTTVACVRSPFEAGVASIGRIAVRATTPTTRAAPRRVAVFRVGARKMIED